jgi:D-alanyl-D-alanine dipeptidase
MAKALLNLIAAVVIISLSATVTAAVSLHDDNIKIFVNGSICIDRDSAASNLLVKDGTMQAPDARMTGLLGRYRHSVGAADEFLIFEDEGRLKMLAGGTYYTLIKADARGGSAGECMKYSFAPGTARFGAFVEFIKILRGENKGSTEKRQYCLFDGRLYHKVIYGGEDGSTYKIKPLKPVEELRKAAFSMPPPREPDVTLECELVNLRGLDRNFKFDIRYATENNFMGARFYDSPGAFLQKPAAHALVRAARALACYGLGVIVYDAYRPWYVTKMFYDATPDAQKNFVADPSKGSRHNRGTAVDVGLYDLATGTLVDMGSGYDEFSERALPSYPGGTSYSRRHRKLLEYYMNRTGFTVYSDEWWHFDYRLNEVKYPIMNAPFDKIEKL